MRHPVHVYLVELFSWLMCVCVHCACKLLILVTVTFWTVALEQFAGQDSPARQRHWSISSAAKVVFVQVTPRRIVTFWFYAPLNILTDSLNHWHYWWKCLHSFTNSIVIKTLSTVSMKLVMCESRWLLWCGVIAADTAAGPGCTARLWRHGQWEWRWDRCCPHWPTGDVRRISSLSNWWHHSYTGVTWLYPLL